MKLIVKDLIKEITCGSLQNTFACKSIYVDGELLPLDTFFDWAIEAGPETLVWVDVNLNDGVILISEDQNLRDRIQKSISLTDPLDLFEVN